jgi:hypothetical protein
MANNENLKPLNEICKEDAKKIRSKGGKARAEKIKAKKTMKEMLDYLLEKEIANKNGDKASTQEAITIALIKEALKGNVKAFEVIRDTIGEKPTEKQETVVKVKDIKYQKEQMKEIINDIKTLADE